MALPGTAAATAIAPVGVAAAPPTADTDPLQSNSIETERFDWADQPLSFPNLEDPEEEEDGEGETEFAQLAEPEPGDPMNASGLYRTPHLNAWATSFVDVDRGQAVAGIGDQPFAQLPTGPIGTVHRFDGTLNAGVRKTPVAGPSESTTYNLNPAMPTVRHQGFGTLDGTSACIPQPLVANPGVGRSYNPAESTSFARQVNFHESYPGAPWPYHAGATPTVAADMGIVGARVIPTIRPNDAQPSGSQSDTEGGPEPHPRKPFTVSGVVNIADLSDGFAVNGDAGSVFDIDQLTPEGQQIYRVCTDIAGQINAIRARHPRRNGNDIRRFQ
ncbi:hypothetical protein FRB90_001973 [Tulasnella sp. 427]|nr:hypothetical protein FRB90_001973 [Tulasnella sp. 427]